MKTIATLSLLAVTGLVACATAAPPHELVVARSAYNSAEAGPAARLNPADLSAAKQSLATAEQSYAAGGDSQDTRDLAYAAQRRAAIADARARARLAMLARGHALAEIHANEAQQLAVTSAELELRRHQVDLQAAEIEELKKIATVRQEARGLVIDLTGAVLFATGKATLLPGAQDRLGRVAQVLAKQDPKGKILVEGYTDSTGSAELNQTLSQERADAVRDFFASHGVEMDRMTSEGFGPAKPVADNATATGRAQNRRVEVVLALPQTGTAPTSTPPSTTSPSMP